MRSSRDRAWDGSHRAKRVTDRQTGVGSEAEVLRNENGGPCLCCDREDGRKDGGKSRLRCSHLVAFFPLLKRRQKKKRRSYQLREGEGGGKTTNYRRENFNKCYLLRLPRGSYVYV